MNIVSLNAAAAIALCVSAAVYTGIAWGHGANGSLGEKASATDVYQVTCSDEESGGTTPSYRLLTKVRDGLPIRKPWVTVSTINGGTTTTTTDKRDGDSRYSAEAHNDSGNGVYVMKVKKSSKVKKNRRYKENYSVQFHCEGPPSSGYIHTGTDFIQTQNQ